jgi:hypothetical protein
MQSAGCGVRGVGCGVWCEWCVVWGVGSGKWGVGCKVLGFGSLVGRNQLAVMLQREALKGNPYTYRVDRTQIANANHAYTLNPQPEESTGMRSSTTTVSQEPSTKKRTACSPFSTHENRTRPCSILGFAAAIANAPAAAFGGESQFFRVEG